MDFFVPICETRTVINSFLINSSIFIPNRTTKLIFYIVLAFIKDQIMDFLSPSNNIPYIMSRVPHISFVSSVIHQKKIHR